MGEGVASPLRPCPFCGGAATVQRQQDAWGRQRWWVVCDNPLCDARGPAHYHRTQAVRAWTIRRVTEEGEPV